MSNLNNQIILQRADGSRTLCKIPPCLLYGEECVMEMTSVLLTYPIVIQSRALQVGKDYEG
jgi:hypothetical protein